MCHWFRATCVCSGHIPHHRCCSVYVISRVQFAFHITLLGSTPQTFSHHISFHPITRKDFTSHHLSCRTIPHHTIPHHTTIAQHSTSHYYIPVFHTTSRRHWVNVATHLASDHHILHNTAVCLGTTISQHVPHHTAIAVHISQFHIHNYSTIHPHSTSQRHISHHNVPHRRIAPPHYIIFHIWHHNHTAHRICHTGFFITIPHPHFTSRNFLHFALCNVPHTRIPHHAIFHIAHEVRHFNHHVWPPFHIHRHHTTFNRAGHNSHQIAPCLRSIPHRVHITPRHAHHHIQNIHCTAHIPHCISTIIPHTAISNMASNHPHHSVFHNYHITDLHSTPPHSTCTTPLFHIASPHLTPRPWHHMWHHTFYKTWYGMLCFIHPNVGVM